VGGATKPAAFGQKDAKLFEAVGKATRDGGTYRVAWDGLDDAGKPVPPGPYMVHVEVNREFGQHIKNMTGTVVCKTKPTSVNLPGNMEVDGIKISFGKAP